MSIRIAPSPPSGQSPKSTRRRQSSLMSAAGSPDSKQQQSAAEESGNSNDNHSGGNAEKYWSVRSVYVAPAPPSGSHCVLQNDLLCTFGGLQKECESLLFKIVNREAALLPSNQSIYMKACQRWNVAPCQSLMDTLSTTPGRYTHAVLDVAGWPLNVPSTEAVIAVLEANRNIISSINLRGCGLREDAWQLIATAITTPKAPPMTRLTKLEISCNHLQSDRDGEALLRVIRAAPALNRVGLLKNRIPKKYLTSSSEMLYERTRALSPSGGPSYRLSSRLSARHTQRQLSPSRSSRSPTPGSRGGSAKRSESRGAAALSPSPLRTLALSPATVPLDRSPSFGIRDNDGNALAMVTSTSGAMSPEDSIAHVVERKMYPQRPSTHHGGNSSSSLRRSPSRLPDGTAESRYTVLPTPPTYRDGDAVKLPKLGRKEFFRAIGMYRDIMTKQTALLETHVLHEAQPAIFEVFRRQTSAIANIDFVTLPRYLCACFPQLSPMQIMHALAFYSEYSLTAPLRASVRDGGIAPDQREQIRKIFDCLDTKRTGILPVSVLHTVRATPLEVEETTEMLKRLQIRELNFDSFASIMGPYLYEQQRRRRRMR